MTQESVEIKLTLETDEVSRDLERMKREMRSAAASSREGSFATGMSRLSIPASASGSSAQNAASPRIGSAAFPSSSDPAALSKLAQREIAKTIGPATKKAVASEIRGINWGELLQSYLRGGGAAVIGDVMSTAGTRAMASGGSAASGAGAGAGAGAASGVAAASGTVLTSAGYVGLAAVLAPMVARKIADDADALSSIVGAMTAIVPGMEFLDDAVTWFQEKAASVDAMIASNRAAFTKTVGLEAARLRIGQRVDASQIGSDYDKLQKIAEIDEKMKRRVNAVNNREIVRELVKQFVAGGSR